MWLRPTPESQMLIRILPYTIVDIIKVDALAGMELLWEVAVVPPPPAFAVGCLLS